MNTLPGGEASHLYKFQEPPYNFNIDTNNKPYLKGDTSSIYVQFRMGSWFWIVEFKLDIFPSVMKNWQIRKPVPIREAIICFTSSNKNNSHTLVGGFNLFFVSDWIIKPKVMVKTC